MLFIATQENKIEKKDGQYTYKDIIYISGFCASNT